ncbi:MAG: 16S rRNA (cytidine(1402)-2'-O)-methyltransferase [Chromatocurvus sp.]
MEAALYIVATPIGNLEDITLRAVATLRSVDLIAAEDTRHTRRLLQHFEIDTRLTAYHEHSGDAEAQRLCQRIMSGQAVALVSDAGTPMISDPGYRLVRAAQAAGVKVVPVPGACAAIAALSASGLPSDRFLFAGFLPARASARQNRLSQLARESATLVFYEAPHRLQETLNDLVLCLGEAREATLARELSKAFETIRRDTLESLVTFVAGDSNQCRGEIVLLVAGCAAEEPEVDAPLADLMQALAARMPPREAASLLSTYSGVRKNRLYSDWLAAQQDHRS